MAAKRRRKAEEAALEQGLAALQTDDRPDIVQQQQSQQRLMQIETIGCEYGSELSHSAVAGGHKLNIISFSFT